MNSKHLKRLLINTSRALTNVASRQTLSSVSPCEVDEIIEPCTCKFEESNPTTTVDPRHQEIRQGNNLLQFSAVNLSRFSNLNVSGEGYVFDSKWQLVPSYGRSFGKEPGRQEFLKYRSKYIHATSNELEWGHFCLKPSDINYYHFIYDSLPYVLLHREFAHSNVIILRTKHSEGLIAALGLEGIVYPIERYDNVRVADCGLFDPPAYSGRPHPVLLKRLRDAIAGVVHKDSKSPKRIYLSRADSGKRRVVNEDAVRTLLDQYGFTTVLMSEHTIMEQLQLIQNADVIVAGHGAALANIIAARSNKTVLIEMFPSSYINNCYAYIATMIGVHYLSLCFESRDGVDDDYCVEIGPLENLLESMT